MTARRPDGTRTGFVIVVAASLGLLVLTAVLAIAATRSFVESSASVDHTLDVRHEIAELGVAMWQAESSERGYVITGRDEYAAPFGRAENAAFAEVERIRELTRDNARQQALVSELGAIVHKRLAQMDVVMQARRTSGESAAVAHIETDEGLVTMAAIRSKLVEMQTIEDALLAERRAAQTKADSRSVVMLAITSVLFGLFMTVASSWARSAQRRRETAEAYAARLSAENAALAERERTTQFQEKFIAILGHDLRNPLSSIRLGVRMVRQLPPTLHPTTLDRVDGSAARMQRMIDQILDLTRSRLGGGIALERKPTNLGKLATDVVAETSLAHGGNPVAFEARGDLDGQWDPDRLAQVVSNLVGNALVYGDESSVKVALAGDGAKVRITVHNAGPPIASELQTALFDPFRRGERDSKAAHTAGLGLGLYITHEIVVAHGGRIDVRSNETEGTTFTVELPR